MKRKNRFLTCLIALTLLLSLTACAAPEKTPAEPTPAPERTGVPQITADPGEEPTSPAPAAPAEQEPEKTCVSVTVLDSRDTVYAQDGETVLLQYACPEIHVSIRGGEAAAAAINAALEEDRNLFAEGGDWEGLSGKESFVEAAREELALRQEQGGAEDFFGYYLVRTADVTRCDDRVLTVLYNDSTYTGGAHGLNNIWSANYDVRTGELLSLEDLTDDPESFLSNCETQLFEVSRDSEHASLAMGGYYPDYQEYLPGLLEQGKWNFSDEGLVFTANQYELAPYAAGAPAFTLPYAWLSWQLKEEYMPPDHAADGSLDGVIVSDDPETTFFVDDGTAGQGACVVLTASGTVEDAAIHRVVYSEYDNSFREDSLLWRASRLSDGESLKLRTWIGDVLPTLKLSWRGENNAYHEVFITQSGKDGSLILMDGQPYTPLPAEISDRLPFQYDIDGDYEPETIDLERTGENGDTRWLLTVDGQAADGEAYAMDAELMSLTLMDLDGDRVCEILFSGDMGSDDYVTCGWHGDTLRPILFTGESRRGADSAAQTTTVDGRVVTDGWYTLQIESWSYQLGTYGAVRSYVTQGDGSLAPMDDFYNVDEWGGFWAYPGNTFFLTVKAPLPVTMAGGDEAVISPGNRILLRGTDGNLVRFSLDEGEGDPVQTMEYGTRGVIRVEPRRNEDGSYGGWTIAGQPEDDYFEMLPYAG